MSRLRDLQRRSQYREAVRQARALPRGALKSGIGAHFSNSCGSRFKAFWTIPPEKLEACGQSANSHFDWSGKGPHHRDPRTGRAGLLFKGLTLGNLGRFEEALSPHSKN